MWSQQNRTDCGGSPHAQLPGMQHADQREKSARGVDVDLGLALEPFLQHPRALVVDAASRHVDRLDLARRQGVSPPRNSSRRSGNSPSPPAGTARAKGGIRRPSGRPRWRCRTPAAPRGSPAAAGRARPAPRGRHAAAAAKLLSSSRSKIATLRSCSISGVGGGRPVSSISIWQMRGHPRLRVQPVEPGADGSPCASRLSDRASRSAAGPMAPSAPGVMRASVVRLRKSMHRQAAENRAERAVGSTWLARRHNRRSPRASRRRGRSRRHG